MLACGSRLGPCEIVAAIGASGMGEVYRANKNPSWLDLRGPLQQVVRQASREGYEQGLADGKRRAVN
jgi:hypothetical protein